MKTRQEFRIVFMGTPDFAVPSLKVLVDAGYEIAAVVTAPEKPKGRGLRTGSTAVAGVATQLNLPVLSPVSLKDESFQDALKRYHADLFVVVAFRMLPESVWKMPDSGTINLHASLLPQYRGAAPINHVIMNGESITGVTTFFINQEIDTGNVIFQESVNIQAEETAGSLHDRLMHIGASLMLKSVDAIRQGKAELTGQQDLVPSDAPLKTAPKIRKSDCRINWSAPAKTIHNHIRGLSPFPGAFSILSSPEGTKYQVGIFKSDIHQIESGNPSTSILISDRNTRLLVGTAAGCIEILEMQFPGKKKLAVSEILKGTRITDEWLFE